jgi:hypothetical protein
MTFYSHQLHGPKSPLRQIWYSRISRFRFSSISNFQLINYSHFILHAFEFLHMMISKINKSLFLSFERRLDFVYFFNFSFLLLFLNKLNICVIDFYFYQGLLGLWMRRLTERN